MTNRSQFPHPCTINLSRPLPARLGASGNCLKQWSTDNKDAFYQKEINPLEFFSRVEDINSRPKNPMPPIPR
jgi:hypothetical protein